MIKFGNLLNDVLFEDKEKELLKIGHVWKKKLPDVYKENLGKYVKRAGNLRDELNGGSWIVPTGKSKILYRGVRDKASVDWEVKNIRKNRKPRDTGKWIDNIIEQVRSKYYPNIPSRRKVKFAGSGPIGLEEIKKYGMPYLVFPERNSNVHSLKKDAIFYFEDIKKAAIDIRKHVRGGKNYMGEKSSKAYKEVIEKFNDKYEDLIELLKIFDFTGLIRDVSFGYNWNKSPSKLVVECREFIYDLDKNHDKFLDKEKSEKNLTKSKVYGKLSKAVENLEIFLGSVSSYFSEMRSGVEPNSGEVIYSGDQYICVHRDFWKFFMKFDFKNQRVGVNGLVKSFLDKNANQQSFDFK